MFLKEFKFFLVYVIAQFCIKPKLMLWFYFSVLKFTLNLWVQEHIGTCGRWQSAPDKSYGSYYQLNSAFQLIKIISICWLKILIRRDSTVLSLLVNIGFNVVLRNGESLFCQSVYSTNLKVWMAKFDDDCNSWFPVQFQCST